MMRLITWSLGSWVVDHHIGWAISRSVLGLLDCWCYSQGANKVQHLELQHLSSRPSHLQEPPPLYWIMRRPGIQSIDIHTFLCSFFGRSGATFEFATGPSNGILEPVVNLL
jgi:hypothetical protein